MHRNDKRRGEQRQNQGPGKLPEARNSPQAALHRLKSQHFNRPDQELFSSHVPQTAGFTVNAVLTAAFNLPDQNLIQEGVEDHVAEMHLKENRSLMFMPTLVNRTPSAGR